jgi:hypothetical protein
MNFSNVWNWKKKSWGGGADGSFLWRQDIGQEEQSRKVPKLQVSGVYVWVGGGGGLSTGWGGG